MLSVIACATPQTLESQAAQGMAQSALAQPWHGTWELDWQEAPIVAPIIFIGWQTEQGVQRRFEILEAPIPSMVGLTYINDSQTSHLFNRLEPEQPLITDDLTMGFSPITDAFTQVAIWLAKPPQSVTQRTVATPHGDGLELTFHYPQDMVLTLQMVQSLNLINQINITGPSINLTLIARSIERLDKPHPELFKVIP
ncbi:MAG: hypothetical protein AAF629_25840 [Chloroflexota bacterium]